MNNFNKIKSFLEKNYFFEDQHLVSLEIEENCITISIGNITNSTFHAGDIETIELQKIVFKNASNTNNIHSFSNNYHNIFDGIEIIEKNNFFYVEISSYPEIKFSCKEIEYKEKITIERRIPLYFNELSFNFYLESNSFISAEKMKYETEKILGSRVDFRIYSGDIVPVEKLKGKDYTGLYLQEYNQILKSEEGVFLTLFSKGKKKHHIFERKRDATDDIWRALHYLPLICRAKEISCGNKKYSPKEWTQVLKIRKILID